MEALSNPKRRGDSDKEDASSRDRVLLYPSAEITISLDIPRSKSMFVIVKVREFSQLFGCRRDEKSSGRFDKYALLNRICLLPRSEFSRLLLLFTTSRIILLHR